MRRQSLLTWTATLLGILLLTTCAETTNLAGLGHRLCALAGPFAPFVLHHRPGTQKSLTFVDQKQMLDLHAKHEPQISSAVDTCCERNHLMNCVCSTPSRRYDKSASARHHVLNRLPFGQTLHLRGDVQLFNHIW